MFNAKQDYKANMTRNMYSCVNNLRGNNKKRERFLRHEDSSLITTDDDIVKKWGKYFGDLLNYEEPEETFPFDIRNGDAQDCTEPTLDKVKSQINNLKNHKSPD